MKALLTQSVFIVGSLIITFGLRAQTFSGYDSKTRKACQLVVLKEFYSGEETKQNYRANIKLILDQFDDNEADDHDHHASEVILEVRFDQKNPKLLIGAKKDNSVQLAIVMNQVTSRLSDPSFYNLKRKHGGHFHIETCKELRSE